MATVAKYTGWVIGRNHAPTPIENTGIPLPYSVIRNVRVTAKFPALRPDEVAFTFDELPKDDFTIGQEVQITIEHLRTPATLSVVEAAEQARASVEMTVVPPPPAPEPQPVVTTQPEPMPTEGTFTPGTDTPGFVSRLEAEG